MPGVIPSLLPKPGHYWRKYLRAQGQHQIYLDGPRWSHSYNGNGCGEPAISAKAHCDAIIDHSLFSHPRALVLVEHSSRQLAGIGILCQRLCVLLQH